MMSNDLYTAEEMAAILKVSRNTVWRYGRKGMLPTVRMGRTVRFGLPREKERNDDLHMREVRSGV